MVYKMEQKPYLVYILIILWIVIGILFLGCLITYTTDYFDQLESRSDFHFDSKWDTMMDFSFAISFLLFLFIVVFSFLLVYWIFTRKSWAWLLGIMISSFLGLYIYSGIQSIGYLIIMDYFDRMFDTAYFTFQYVTYFVMIFFVPLLLIIFTRPQIKTYFGKT